MVTTDRLRSHRAAFAGTGLAARHEWDLRKDNRAEASHQQVRRREHRMQRFESPGSARRFPSTHAAVHDTFDVQRHLISRRTPRALRAEAMARRHGATSAG